MRRQADFTAQPVNEFKVVAHVETKRPLWLPNPRFKKIYDEILAESPKRPENHKSRAADSWPEWHPDTGKRATRILSEFGRWGTHPRGEPGRSLSNMRAGGPARTGSQLARRHHQWGENSDNRRARIAKVGDFCATLVQRHWRGQGQRREGFHAHHAKSSPVPHPHFIGGCGGPLDHAEIITCRTAAGDDHRPPAGMVRRRLRSSHVRGGRFAALRRLH